jgi:transcriptional regulator with XRE-family HTH domain
MSRLIRTQERRAAAAFILDRRSRTQPEDVGLVVGARRRARGLRREEVAQLAGVGLTWYTWFEQGRDIKVSADFLERLCRVFQLTHAERSYLFALIQQRPAAQGQVTEDNIPQGVRSLLVSLPNPAYVMTARWDVLAWNKAASKLFVDFERLPPEHRNIIRLVFTEPAYRTVMVNWESDARRLLEKFRLDYARAHGDPSFEELVDDIRVKSASFDRWWPQQEVCGFEERIKRLRDPKHGERNFDHVVLSVEPTRLRLVLYMPCE